MPQGGGWERDPDSKFAAQKKAPIRPTGKSQGVRRTLKTKRLPKGRKSFKPTGKNNHGLTLAARNESQTSKIGKSSGSSVSREGAKKRVYFSPQGVKKKHHSVLRKIR